MSTKDFPSLRDIFNQFDFTDFTTPEYEKLDKRFSEKLAAAVPQFDKNDELRSLAIGCCIEAHATGFEQGFAFAIKLLLT